METFLHYQILKLLGRGGFSEVFSAIDTNTGEKVAIKFLFIPTADEEGGRRVRRFLREAKNLSKVSHPNIVRFREAGEHEGRHYIVMDFVDGTPLSQMHPPLDLWDAINYICQVGDALSELHRHNLVHRDVKPANIIVTPEEKAVLVDFGLARHLGAGSSVTTTSEIIGTPAYMSPEQVLSSELTRASDIYSLAGTLYYCLTGRHPVDSGGLAYKDEIYEKVVRGQIEPFISPPPNIPKNVLEVIKKAMQKNYKKRYQDVMEFVHDLGLCLEGKDPFAVKRRRKKIFIGLACAGVVLICVLIIFFLKHFYMGRDIRESPPPYLFSPPKQSTAEQAPTTKKTEGEIQEKPIEKTESKHGVVETGFEEPEQDYYKLAVDELAQAQLSKEPGQKIEKLKKAIDYLSQAIEQGPDEDKLWEVVKYRAEASYQCAEILREQLSRPQEANKFYNIASEDFSKLIQKAPDNKQSAEYYYKRGHCYFYLNQKTKAAQDWDMAETLDSRFSKREETIPHEN